MVVLRPFGFLPACDLIAEVSAIPRPNPYRIRIPSMDNRDNRTKSYVAVSAVIILLVLAALYVASSGPAAAMVVKDSKSDRFLLSIRAYKLAYAPLIAAELRSEIVRTSMQNWRGLFIGEDTAVWAAACWLINHEPASFRYEAPQATPAPRAYAGPQITSWSDGLRDTFDHSERARHRHPSGASQP